MSFTASVFRKRECLASGFLRRSLQSFITGLEQSREEQVSVISWSLEPEPALIRLGGGGEGHEKLEKLSKIN